MKKIISILSILLFTASCSKKEEVLVENSAVESNSLPYDTTAIDSFAPGANPGNVIMNRVIVDSAAVAKMEDAKLVAKLKKEEAEKKEKAKLDEDTKKKEAEKKKAEEAAKKKKTEEKPKKEETLSPSTEVQQ